MVSFKTFMKIRYPEWENERLRFEPQRPDIDKLYQSNNRLKDTPDVLTRLILMAKIRNNI